MLSLVLGSGITDASVAAIASSFSKLELLDLSGYVSSPDSFQYWPNICSFICRILSEVHWMSEGTF